MQQSPCIATLKAKGIVNAMRYTKLMIVFLLSIFIQAYGYSQEISINAPKTQNVGPLTGSAIFNVQTSLPSESIDTALVEEAAWITSFVYDSTESTGATLSVVYQENNTTLARTAKIVVRKSDDNTIADTATIVQAPSMLSLQPDTLKVNYVNSSEAGLAIFKVETNLPFDSIAASVLNSVSWLNNARYYGTDSTLRVSYQMNATLSERTGKVVIMKKNNSSITDTATIVQAPHPMLSIQGSDTQMVSSSRDSVTFKMGTNLSGDSITVMVLNNDDWLNARYEPTDSTLRVSYQMNATLSERTGKVVIMKKNNSSITDTATIVQAPHPMLSIQGSDTQMVSSSRDSVTFKMGTNLSGDSITVMVLNNDDWLNARYEPTDSTLRVSYQMNDTLSERTGRVVIMKKNDDAFSDTATIVQAPHLILSISTEDTTVTSDSGKVDFKVTTNLPDSLIMKPVVYNTTWLSASYDSDTLHVTYQENTAMSERRGMIYLMTDTTVYGSYSIHDSVTVIQQSASPYLSVGPKRDTVTSDSGRVTFMVMTNLHDSLITVSVDTTWLSVRYDSNTLFVNYDANTGKLARTGRVFIRGNNTIYDTVFIVQDAPIPPTLSISPKSDTVSSGSGMVTFTFRTNLPNSAISVRILYTDSLYTDSTGWLMVTDSSNTLLVTYRANTDTVARTGRIVVAIDSMYTDGDIISDTATVIQSATSMDTTTSPVTPTLSISPKSDTVSSGSGMVTFTFRTNLPNSAISVRILYTDSLYTDSTGWLMVTDSSNTLLVTYRANTDTVARTGRIVVAIDSMYTDGDIISDTATVIQSATSMDTTTSPVTPTLSISPKSRTVSSDSGMVTFTVTTNLPDSAISGGILYTDSLSTDWLMVDHDFGSNILNVTYQANTGMVEQFRDLFFILIVCILIG
jgi:hypothetical protein